MGYFEATRGYVIYSQVKSSQFISPDLHIE